ncbi:hypothetical protein C0995_007113 [Termitomyces sp. Mi166|nr:hypothetical protein C0995_007113 [Termitomyces sp. Mi166\
MAYYEGLHYTGVIGHVSYQNEVEAGIAIRESGLARQDIFITTKFSGRDGLDIPTSIHNSLKNLGVTYVDLYLIHHPSLAVPDVPTAWRQMEELKEKGLARSIGVSNFGVADLQILLASAKIKPAVNQVVPITRLPGGPLDKPLNEIAKRLNATLDQVLFAWVKAKGAVVVT